MVCFVCYLHVEDRVLPRFKALLDGCVHFCASGGGILQRCRVTSLPMVHFLKMQKSFAINRLSRAPAFLGKRRG